MADRDIADPVDEVLELFADHGDERYDEGVTMTEHCVQTAVRAEEAGAPARLVAAALLHDIGHLLLARDRRSHDYLRSDWDHERIGAEWLRPRFGATVADPVGLHVDAKRYLCATDDDYHRLLSVASMRSLDVQGGPFSAEQAAAFAADASAPDALRIRRWDDAGKVVGEATRPVAAFAPLLRAVATGTDLADD